MDEIVIKAGTKQLLLDAAMAEIAQTGIEGFRIESILKATGASFSSLYHHFKNRDGIITAALVASFRLAIDQDIDAIEAQAQHAKTTQDVANLVKAGLDGVLTDLGALTRDKQIAVLAASITRPDLQQAIASAQAEAANRVGQLFEGFKEHGLLPQTADIEGFAWFSQQLVLGLKVTDLNVDDLSRQRAGEVALKAALSILGI